MIEMLSQYPLVLLFLVASLGYLVGSFKIGGFSLGVAAILFVGLFFGAVDPRLQIPDIVLQLGLSIYVYSIGLSSGPAFFESYRRNGIRDFSFLVVMLLTSGLMAAAVFYVFDISSATVAGLYCGSSTNTPALAGVLDLITNGYEDAAAAGLTQQAVIGYSYSYPMGVMGGIIAIVIMEKLMSIDYKAEAHKLRRIYPVGEKVTSRTVKITNPDICDITLRNLRIEHEWLINFGRVYKDGKVSLSHPDVTLNLGDLVMIVGNKEDLDFATIILGETTKSSFTYDRTEFDGRRIFLSNSELVGKSISSLNLREKYNAIVTRIRRGDIEMLVNADTVLELGDRVRFMAERKDMNAISEYFGDSYAQSSKVNLFSFGLGIGLGLLLGSIQIPFGANGVFQLGYAGGPLIVGLILGALRRTGSIVWILPYSANVTLQQIGLILLLSVIGVRSGSAFIDSFSADAGIVFMGSVGISILTAMLMLFVGYKLVKIPFTVLMGMVSNQPAILDFAIERSGNRIPMNGFTMIFPIALIMKILIAQLLFTALS